MDLCKARCEDKPSPACEHAVPSSRVELLIRTIAETNMALWTFGSLGQVNNDKPWVSLMRQAAFCGHEPF